MEVFLQGLFSPDQVAEMVVRGTAMYWFLFLVMRFAVLRDIGQMGVADLLFVVIVADAAQNAMAGEYDTVTDGIVLVGTLAFWNRVTDSLSYRSKAFRRFAEPRAVLLVEDGKRNRRAMRQHLVTDDELDSKLRVEGVEHLSQVKAARLEPDGEISVIQKE